jgi:hypothetical protein
MKTDGSFEQLAAGADVLGDSKDWLKEEDSYIVTLWNDVPIAVTPPNFIILEVVETDPHQRAIPPPAAPNRRRSPPVRSKVPLFISVGDVLKIDTRTGTYVSRAQQRRAHSGWRSALRDEDWRPTCSIETLVRARRRWHRSARPRAARRSKWIRRCCRAPPLPIRQSNRCRSSMPASGVICRRRRNIR